ncbi:hypothetical protein [Xanthocytophaga agilis]|uniref:Uncharacterized protein n=1 Tax=Xanthocytophaga agilis TaxID=3048010 RepID=A0AAE3UHN8_9BACT|nr:hypothetical protein [Xanthocytophaga agilis]MDJ1503687.1 hypothetical protein [Xanthocytophaga agilis]
MYQRWMLVALSLCMACKTIDDRKLLTVKEEYVYFNNIKFQVIDSSQNSIVDLCKLITDTSLKYYLKNNFNRYCILSISNESTVPVQLTATDSCFVVTSAYMKGRYLGKQPGDSITYIGYDHFQICIFNTPWTPVDYRLLPKKNVYFYLPYITNYPDTLNSKLRGRGVPAEMQKVDTCELVIYYELDSLEKSVVHGIGIVGRIHHSKPERFQLIDITSREINSYNK